MFPSRSPKAKISLLRCFLVLLTLALTLGVLFACKPGTSPDQPDDPPDNGGDEGDKTPPPEPYVPNTEPLIREEGVLYIQTSGTYQCNSENQDKPFIHLSAGTTLEYCRFADGYDRIMYKFDIHTKYEPLLEFTIGNDYMIEISPDGKEWIEVYNWLDEHETCRDRSNEAAFTIDPYEWEVFDTCYIRFSDPSKADGCGPCITKFTFSYYEDSKLESLNIFIIIQFYIFF